MYNKHYTQENLQSGKFATLGKMIAEITHEMNTPAGAIKAGITNLNHHLKALLESLGGLLEQGLTRQDVERILHLIGAMATVLDDRHRRRPGEVRNDQKKIAELLETQGIAESQSVAKQIARMELGPQIDDVLILMKNYDLDTIFTMLTHCHRIINSTRDMQVSIHVLTDTIQALKSYIHPKQETVVYDDIHESIETALTILNSKLKHRIQVERQYDELPSLWCYPNELSHVWINLLYNAIQAINGEGRILIKTLATDTELGVHITDTGVGIPAEIQARIFDTDFTTKSQGEGSGIGLHIVRAIVAKHGGRIEVDSIPGKTTFAVFFPLTFLQPDVLVAQEQ